MEPVMYNSSNTYQQIAVQTSSPARLVVMLYEGAVRFLRDSVGAIESKDLERKRQSIDRAVAIVQHLHSTLDMEKGGKVAEDLHQLYSYVMARILEGSAKLESAPLEEALKLLNVLLAGWEELAKKELAPAVPPQMVAQQAAGGGIELHA
jgi:flagellar protein FliS